MWHEQLPQLMVRIRAATPALPAGHLPACTYRRPLASFCRSRAQACSDRGRRSHRRAATARPSSSGVRARSRRPPVASRG
eukprot:2303539-Prymnesium_polylepis.1